MLLLHGRSTRPLVSAAAQCPWRRRRVLVRQQTSRKLTTAPVTDQVIAELAAEPLHPLTLADLVRYGRPPLPASQLYRSANFTLSILPARLAHRIQALQNLPFIVVSNPHVSKIHENYLHSMSTLLPLSQRHIDNVDDEARFSEVMADLVQTHANTIPILARGFLEARRYIGPREVTGFLDEHLRARIGTRLIAEQHLALSFSSQPHNETGDGAGSEDGDRAAVPSSSYIGVIDTELCPASVVRHCESMVGDICEFRYGVRPSVVINGEPDYTFAHIPVHLEYIITELLKNAFRATVERGKERDQIEVTIAPLPDTSPDSAWSPDAGRDQETLVDAPAGGEKKMKSASAIIRPLKQSTPGVTIRIRDRGGGIAPDVLRHVWDYSFTTFDEEAIKRTGAGESSGSAGLDALNAISGADGGSSLAGLGYGLPLGRAYAEYFGGGIAVQSLWGWGTDVYLSLRGVGKVECEGKSRTE